MTRAAYRTGYLDGLCRCGWWRRYPRLPLIPYAIGYAFGRCKPGLEGW
jgi:hypothetical protein